ncbi:MAG: Beta-barrel assembly-enhancing protease [Phycisphaerae bacterium]|nr:Beta-barrel assembly-enhancing protease [Phycisphaerae bacterium]
MSDPFKDDLYRLAGDDLSASEPVVLSPTEQTASEPSPDEFTPAQKAVLDDPAVRQAIDAGKPARIHRLLEKKLKACADPEQRVVIRELLSNRRLFIQRAGAPGLSRVNGIGHCLMGRTDFDPRDNTYIATLWFTFLFIPLFPVRQYLVRDAQPRGWYFFGSVPMTGGPRIYGRSLLVGLLLVALASAWTVYRTGTRADLHVLNALDVSVVVDVGDRSVRVAPGGHETLRVPTGDCRIKVTDSGGRVLDEHDDRIPAWKKLVVYNVLGAAPLYQEKIHYYAGKAPGEVKGNPNDVTWLIGRRVVVFDTADYPFKQPPRTIEMDAKLQVVERICVDVAPGGWMASLRYMTSGGDFEKAARFLEPVAMAEPDNLAAVSLAAGFARRSRGPQAAADLLAPLLKTHPDSVDLHRVYQDSLQAAGQVEQARAIYRKMAEEQPDSPAAAYLRARIEQPEAAIVLLDGLAKRFPKDVYIVRARAWGFYVLRRFDEAIPAFDQLADLSEDEFDSALRSIYALCLTAAGRGEDALRSVARFVDAHADELDYELAVIYARLLRRYPNVYPAQDEEYVLRKFVMGGEEAPPVARFNFALRVRGGVPALPGLEQVEDPTARDMLELMMAIADSPDRAVAIVRKGGDPLLDTLPEEHRLLLLCEAGRLNESALVDRLASRIYSSSCAPAVLRAFALEGAESPELADMVLNLQAVLDFARARRAQSAGEPADDQLAKARADEILPGVVSWAIDHWPRPAAMH